MKRTIAKSTIAVIIGLFILNSISDLKAESIGEKSEKRRVELTHYLRLLRPMVFNFPCEPMPQCKYDLPAEERKSDPWERTRLYNEIKKIFQEGLIYHYEGDYINANTRFLDALYRIDSVMEELSQIYIDRAQRMMRDSIEKRYPDDERDKSLVDISMEYGPNSKVRRDFMKDREAGYSERRYDAKLYHYAQYKSRIEANMKKGYENLGYAKQARIDAIRIEEHLPSHRHINPEQRNKRIQLYINAIYLARRSKFNAEMIYNLKYPFANYAMTNPYSKNEKEGLHPEGIPEIQGTKIKWSDHPDVLPKKLHPIFNLSIPDKYRVDVVDIRNMRYDDERAEYLQFKFREDKPDILVSDKESDAAGGNNTNNAQPPANANQPAPGN